MENLVPKIAEKLSFHINDHILFCKDGSMDKGILRYIGPVEGKKEIYCGIEI